MKKIAVIFLLIFLFVACDDGGKTSTADDDSDLLTDADLIDEDLIVTDETSEVDQEEDEDVDDVENDDPESPDDDVVETGPVSCSSTQDCQEKERSAGFLCSDSRCIPCETDDQCKEDVIFGEYGACETGRCSVSPGCLDSGCEGSQICDETTRLCRDKYNCDNDICKENQKCHDSGEGADDYCLEECISGYTWDSISLNCKSVAENCQPGKENSLYETCLTDFRVV